MIFMSASHPSIQNYDISKPVTASLSALHAKVVGELGHLVEVLVVHGGLGGLEGPHDVLQGDGRLQELVPVHVHPGHLEGAGRAGRARGQVVVAHHTRVVAVGGSNLQRRG